MTNNVPSHNKSLSIIECNDIEKDHLQGDNMQGNRHDENLHILEDVELESNSFNLKCIKSPTKFIDG